MSDTGPISKALAARMIDAINSLEAANHGHSGLLAIHNKQQDNFAEVLKLMDIRQQRLEKTLASRDALIDKLVQRTDLLETCIIQKPEVEH